MKILSLDISSKTGFSLLWVNPEEPNGFKLLESGTLAKTSQPSGPYPKSMLDWAANSAALIIDKFKSCNPDVVVIEETSKGSKNAMSQKVLEYTHFIVATYLIEQKLQDLQYLLTGEWRVLTGCAMTKEEKKRNKAVKKQHDQGIKVAKNAEGKRIGKITKKHVNIRRANEIFSLNLIKKDEDQADALLLGVAYLKKKYGIDI